MAKLRSWLLVSLFLTEVLFLEAAKILTIATLGGSHCLVMNRVSQILQYNGHNVTQLLNAITYIPDFKKEKISYQVLNWHLPENQEKEFRNRLNLLSEELVHESNIHQVIVKTYKFFGDLCSHFLGGEDIMDSLRNENFDLLFFDYLDFCSYLIAEKLEKKFVTLLPLQFSYINIVLPSPLSYVPVYGSRLTDQMDFWGRVKNFLMFFDFSMKQREIFSQYDATIQEHFAEDSRPVLSDLLLKAELWFVNSDFAFEFARPLLPNTVYVGGLMDKPARPLPQV